MAVYAHDSQFMTRRGAVLVTIIALHVFIAWALATGLARRALEVIAPPIQTDIVEERKVERSEEHTSELQSQSNLVCRLLLEKKRPSHRLVIPSEVRNLETIQR